MGKTPAQENRLRAKKAGMSHDKVKEEQAKDVREQKKLANKDLAFGKKQGLITKDKVMAQRLKDMNDPTTELGKATARAARKAAKEAEEFLLRTKGISIKQKEVPPGVDPKTILCEYFRYGCCAKTAEKCKFSHKMDVVTRFQGSGSNVKRDIYEDDQADEADTMELWDQAKLESVIAKKHGAEATSSNATTIVCKHFLQAVESRKYGWFWNCPGGAACKYKHKLPKGYQFKSDIVAMMRAAAMNKKSDQDELREELEKLKANGPGTPVTLEVFVEWKTKRAEARRERETKARQERQKKGLFTGKELCEAADMNHGSDEGSADDDAEFKELLRLKKQAEEEEEKRVAAEAAAALEKAKASGEAYGEEDLEWGISTDELAAAKGDDESDYTDSEEEVEEIGDDGKPKAVIKRIRRRKEEKPADDEEDDEKGGGGGGGARERKGRRISSPRALRRRRCSSRRRRTPTRWRRSSARTRWTSLSSTPRSSADDSRRRRRRRRLRRRR